MASGRDIWCSTVWGNGNSDKKNHKTKGNNKNRETKREKEKDVLTLFKRRKLIKKYKTGKKNTKQADQETKKIEELFSKPPPYLPQKDSSQYLRVPQTFLEKCK